MRIKVIANGNPMMTKVANAETGKPIDGVKRIEFVQDIDTGEISLTLRVVEFDLDIEQDPVLQRGSSRQGGGTFAPCTNCGSVHVRTRKVRPDQPAYCEDCRAEAIRATKAKSAAKRRAAEHQN